jgi:RHS repeat-associated protein
MLVAESPGSGADTFYIYGPGGLPVASITGSAVRYFHHDQLGSTRVLTDATGRVVGTYSWDPCGRPAGRTGTDTPRLGYAGQYTDPETGLGYLRARHYQPTTGRFLTRDPLVSLSREPYGYAANDPVNHTDPTGLFGIPGTDWCVDILDDNCNSIAEQHSEASQVVADFSGGVLDTMTFGNGGEITGGLGIDDRVRWDSPAAYVGRIAGLPVNVYGAAAAPAVFTTLQAFGGVESTWHACSGHSFDASCGTTGAFALASIFLPMGAGRGMFAMTGDDTMAMLASGYASWLTDAGSIFRDQIDSLYC